MVIDTFFFLTLATMTGAGAVLWFRWLSGPVNLFSLHAHPKPFGLIDVIICFVAWMSVPAIMGSLSLQFIGVDSWDALDSAQKNVLALTVAIGQIAIVVVVSVWVSWKYGYGKQIFGLTNVVAYCWTAIRAFAMVVPLLLLLQWLLSLLVPYGHSTLEQIQEDFSLATVAVSWVGAAIAAPLCEELFFRGFLQAWLQRISFEPSDGDPTTELMGGWPGHVKPDNEVESEQLPNSPSAKNKGYSWYLIQWWWPIVITSGLFAAVHIGQGLAPITLFFFGLALGYLYRVTGSVLPAIYLHFLLNAFSLFWVTLEGAVGS